MKKILLVNSQEAFLDRNKSLLNRAGFRILTASSVEEALAICRHQEISLIISQLERLPAGGDQLCTQLRADRVLRNVSIILVSYLQDADFAATCGANAVLTKPVRPEELLKLVGKFLEIRARREYRAVFNARVDATWGSLSFSGVTRNISASGLLCETSVLLRKDDQLSNVLFDLAGFPITAEAVVVWSGSLPAGTHVYGVKFSAMAAEQRERIDQYVVSTAQHAPLLQ
ncbi:hypothetical protein GMLC_31990 [Geomonas limicola]|uniref:Response regulatory domain-containing protein n=1 Tax=Geomonas limicola TaxID=2740186 RepID=A0A6V8NAZ4_9BACT|nr:PilZ domain-containing protein [Geomonas limicola]GFO69620.1 hypothetical protein GMLC_31990 [Geomonas limicola]